MCFSFISKLCEKYKTITVQFYIANCVTWVVVQSLSCVWHFPTLETAAHQASLSFTVSQSLLKLTSMELMMPSNHLIFCCSLLLLPSIFPSIKVFSNESTLHQVAKLLDLQLQLVGYLGLFFWTYGQIGLMSKLLEQNLCLGRGLTQRRQWHSTPVLLPGKSHRRRSLVGCSPWGREGSDMIEWLHFHFYALEKEMATHSSVLAWRIPGMGLHRVGHDWSNLAAAAEDLLYSNGRQWPGEIFKKLKLLITWEVLGLCNVFLYRKICGWPLFLF